MEDKDKVTEDISVLKRQNSAAGKRLAVVDETCKKGQFDKAESFIKRAIEGGRMPYPSTWEYLATGYINSNQIPKGLEMMKKAMSLKKYEDQKLGDLMKKCEASSNSDGALPFSSSYLVPFQIFGSTAKGFEEDLVVERVIKFALATLLNLHGCLTPCYMAPMNQYPAATMSKSREDVMGKVGKEASMVGAEIVQVQQEEEHLLEWDVEFDEGVMVTLVAHPHGGYNRMKRIRFRKDLDRYNSVMGPQRSNPAQEISSIWGEEKRGALALSDSGSCSSHGPKKKSTSSMASDFSGSLSSVEVSSGPSLEAWEEDRD
ncbi:hypothetical protein ACLOJK_002107 [Asimina triloba]